MLSLKKCPSNQEHGSANPDTEEEKKLKCRIRGNSPPWNHKDLGPNSNVSSYEPCECPTLQMTTLRPRRLRDLIVRPRRNQSSLTSDLWASLFCTTVLELTSILGLPLGLKGEKTNLDCTLSLWHFTLCNWKKKKNSHKMRGGFSSSFLFTCVHKFSLLTNGKSHTPDSFVMVSSPPGKLHTSVQAVHCTTPKGMPFKA